jgi:uncharacterized protein
MILVEVANTFLVNMGKEFVILLRSSDDDRTLPISIGQLEAQSIAITLNQVPFPRPLTHDLFKAVITDLDCKLTSVVINDLADETFYAKLLFVRKGKMIEADSRPSDAIALALRFSAPIYVEDKVMDAAGVIMDDQEDAMEKTHPENNIEQQDLELDMLPVESLQKQLQKAISEERYEDAAEIRDEIDKMTKSN